MLYGFDDLQKTFKRLADARDLSHAYLLYGQPQTGKFLFAMALASYLETGIFDAPPHPLQETHMIDFSARERGDGDESGAESVGIDAIRDIERFLYQTPALAPYRTVIIRDAHWLTDQAQNALLKILEEPPAHSLIIATAYDTSVFLPPVASRFVKVYISPLSEQQVLDLCSKYDIIRDVHSIKNSYGRIGRICDAAKDVSPLTHEAQRLAARACDPRASSASLRTISDEAYDFVSKSSAHGAAFFEAVLISLHQDVIHYAGAINDIIRTIALDQHYTISKRIHLKHILWTIHSYSHY